MTDRDLAMQAQVCLAAWQSYSERNNQSFGISERLIRECAQTGQLPEIGGSS